MINNQDEIAQRSHFTGLVAAAFSPMHSDGSLDLARVAPLMDHLAADGVGSVFICGTTGEGLSLSSSERMATAKAFVEGSAGRMSVIVQVGHNSLAEARRLAFHAQCIGAQAIAAVPPMYFRPSSPKNLIECLAQIADGAPDLPFYYYHIPGLTGVEVDVPNLLRQSVKQLPTLAGIKFSASSVSEFQACAELDGGRFNMLFGCDEELLSGLVAGADGAVGSTYNFAAPLYLNIIEAFKRGDMEEASRLQEKSVRMVEILGHFPFQPALKAMMRLIGVDCGPNRLPLIALQDEEVQVLKRELEAIGFFEWGRSSRVGKFVGKM